MAGSTAAPLPCGAVTSGRRPVAQAARTLTPRFPDRYGAMARKIWIGMPGFLLLCLIGSAGYRLGRYLAGHEGAATHAPA